MNMFFFPFKYEFTFLKDNVLMLGHKDGDTQLRDNHRERHLIISEVWALKQ